MVVFLPFIGLYLTAKTAVGGVTGVFHRSAKDLAATVTPGWAPCAALEEDRGGRFSRRPQVETIMRNRGKAITDSAVHRDRLHGDAPLE